MQRFKLCKSSFNMRVITRISCKMVYPGASITISFQNKICVDLTLTRGCTESNLYSANFVSSQSKIPVHSISSPSTFTGQFRGSAAHHRNQHRRLQATLQHCIGVWHRHAWSQITGWHCTGSPSPTPLIAMSIARSHKNKSTFRIVFPYAI